MPKGQGRTQLGVDLKAHRPVTLKGGYIFRDDSGLVTAEPTGPPLRRRLVPSAEVPGDATVPRRRHRLEVRPVTRPRSAHGARAWPPSLLAGQLAAGGALVNDRVENLVSGREFQSRVVDNMRERLKSSVPTFAEDVVAVASGRREGRGNRGRGLLCARRILATGSGYTIANVPGEGKVLGRGVSYCATLTASSSRTVARPSAAATSAMERRRS